MSGWRVWLAFEVKPGITNTSDDRSDHWRGLAEACRASNGKVDPIEFNRWLDCLIDHSHMWGEA